MSFLCANSGDYRNPSLDEQFERALASVRRMAEDYAAAQNKTIAAVLADANVQCADLAQELSRCRSQCETLRAALVFLANRDEPLCWCSTPVCVNQPGCENARRVLAATDPQRSAARS